jgi:hypothetical protein
MNFFNLFQNPKHNQAQRLQQAQAKIADLNLQLAFVAKESRCQPTTKLQLIKSKLQTELEFWVAELKQAEATLAQSVCSGASQGLGDRMRHSGLPP